MLIPQHFKPLTIIELSKAWTKVWRELDGYGFTCKRLASCQVYLGVVSRAYGYQWFGDREDGKVCGDIILPSVSFCHLGDFFWGRPKVSAVEILRHEYGHAFADVNRRRIESKKFEQAFGWPHDTSYDGGFEYDPEFHITEYASLSTGEDFAETLWMYLKHKGKLPKMHQTQAITRKWKFVESLRKF